MFNSYIYNMINNFNNNDYNNNDISLYNDIIIIITIIEKNKCIYIYIIQ